MITVDFADSHIKHVYCLVATDKMVSLKSKTYTAFYNNYSVFSVKLPFIVVDSFMTKTTKSNYGKIGLVILHVEKYKSGAA